MSDGEFHDNGPVGRARATGLYYLKLNDRSNTLANFSSHAEDLMREIDLGLGESEIDLRVREAMEGIHHETPPEVLVDKMASVPFDLLSEHIDVLLERKEALDLYGIMLTQARSAIRAEHGADCLVHEPYGVFDCEFSPSCPRITIGRNMAHLALNGYDPLYEEICGPLHDDYDLGLSKIQLAVKMGFISYGRSTSISAVYTQRRTDYLRAIAKHDADPSLDGSSS